MKIANPLNPIQVEFNELCTKGGGAGGGPALTKVQELLHNGLMALLVVVMKALLRQAIDREAEARSWRLELDNEVI